MYYYYGDSIDFLSFSEYCEKLSIISLPPLMCGVHLPVVGSSMPRLTPGSSTAARTWLLLPLATALNTARGLGAALDTGLLSLSLLLTEPDILTLSSVSSVSSLSSVSLPRLSLYREEENSACAQLDVDWCLCWLAGGGRSTLAGAPLPGTGDHWPSCGSQTGFERREAHLGLRDFDDANVSLFLSRGVEPGSHLAAAV